MPLDERVFRCEACGQDVDRDLNAARNLASLVAGSSPEAKRLRRGRLWPGELPGETGPLK
jgi:putative transposase